MTPSHLLHGMRMADEVFFMNGPRTSPRIVGYASCSALAAWLQHSPHLPPIPIASSRSWFPFLPGGGTDVVARTLAQEMAKDLGISVIIENKPGAGTIIGTQSVASSALTAIRC